MPYAAKLAYDHRGEEGLNLIRQYVEMWARSHGGLYPTADEVTYDGPVGRQNGGLYWPSNPWDHANMAQRADHGSFSYTVAANQLSYTLTLHRALKKDYVLTGSSAVSAQAARDVSFVDQQVEAGILLLQGYINTWGANNGFVYPTKTMVKKGGGLTAPIWPANPWTGKIMVPGTGRGAYTYTLTSAATGYRLVGHLSKGSFKVKGGVPKWLTAERLKANDQLVSLEGAS